jgi:hypothetical protein
VSSPDVQPVAEGTWELSWSEIDELSLQAITGLRQVLSTASKSVAKFLWIMKTLDANDPSTLRLTLSLTRQGTRAVLKAQLCIVQQALVSNAPSSSQQPGSSRFRTTHHTGSWTD